MTTSRTQVAIVGGGPAGLMLSHLLHLAGIETVVLDNRTVETIENTHRAGILEHDSVRLLVESGVSDRVLTASVMLPRNRYDDDAKRRAFTDEALRRVRALPGVVAAGATDTIPFGGYNSDSVILAEGYQMKPGESVISPSQVTVSPGYFEATGVRPRFLEHLVALGIRMPGSIFEPGVELK